MLCLCYDQFAKRKRKLDKNLRSYAWFLQSVSMIQTLTIDGLRKTIENGVTKLFSMLRYCTAKEERFSFVVLCALLSPVSQASNNYVNDLLKMCHANMNLLFSSKNKFAFHFINNKTIYAEQQQLPSFHFLSRVAVG